MKLYAISANAFIYKTPIDAAAALWTESQYSPGEEAIIFTGEEIKAKASDFLVDIASDMEDRAGSEMGDSALAWSIDKGPAKDLQEVVAHAVDKWASANNAHPNFSRVTETGMLLIRFGEHGTFRAMTRPDISPGPWDWADDGSSFVSKAADVAAIAAVWDVTMALEKNFLEMAKHYIGAHTAEGHRSAVYHETKAALIKVGYTFP